MKITHEQYYFCYSEIANYKNKEDYISDLALSSVWGECEDEAKIIVFLNEIWNVVDGGTKYIRNVLNITQSKFSVNFLIPKRSIENWESGTRKCPDYVVIHVAQIAGILPIPED